MLRSNAHCIALEYEEKHVLMEKTCGCIRVYYAELSYMTMKRLEFNEIYGGENRYE